MSLLSFLARRFVAGEAAEAVVEAARKMKMRGVGSILDFLGEDVHTAADARVAVDEYRQLLSLIQAAALDACISMKASQMGLLISRELCLENIRQVLGDAQGRGLFVWMDMEGSALTEATIEIFQKLRDDFPNFGLCVQAYLRRTEKDLDALLGKPGHLRLCKGAYREPPAIAFSEKKSVDAAFRLLTEKLLGAVTGGAYAAWATHDPALIDFVLERVRELGVRPAQFEFQMLYGIQNKRLERLAGEGFRTRVYIPYGRAWLPYFLRRLRERRENIYFLLKNLFRR